MNTIRRATQSEAPIRPALVIPALNEEPVIARMLRGIPPGLFAAIVVADNGSTDRTREIAAECGAHVVTEPRRGYGAACLKALDALAPDIDTVVFMQADCSENPEEARRLLEPIARCEAGLVIGSRVTGAADPGALLPHQRFGNLLAISLIRWLYGFRYTDLGPFRAIRVDVLRRLHMRELAFGWTVEMQVRALEEGILVCEVPVSYHKRAAGENKVSGNLKASLKAGFVILATVFRLWLARGSRRRRGATPA